MALITGSISVRERQTGYAQTTIALFDWLEGTKTMRIQEQVLKHLHSFPHNVVLVSVIFLGVAFTLTSRTPTKPPISDFAYYVDMANGLPAPDPFG